MEPHRTRASVFAQPWELTSQIFGKLRVKESGNGSQARDADANWKLGERWRYSRPPLPPRPPPFGPFTLPGRQSHAKFLEENPVCKVPTPSLTWGNVVKFWRCGWITFASRWEAGYPRWVGGGCLGYPHLSRGGGLIQVIVYTVYFRSGGGGGWFIFLRL